MWKMRTVHTIKNWMHMHHTHFTHIYHPHSAMMLRDKTLEKRLLWLAALIAFVIFIILIFWAAQRNSSIAPTDFDPFYYGL